MKTKIFTRFLAIAFLLLGTFAAKAQCLPAWNYVTPITVSNGNASDLLTYQVKVTVNTQALIAAGKMLSTGTDIRFTDPTTCANLWYWIETPVNLSTSAATVIWVKTAKIPSGGSQIVNMYYGNTAATVAQTNGDSTFDLFEDFSASVTVSGVIQPDTSKWTTNVPTSTAFTFATTGTGTQTVSKTAINAILNGSSGSIYSKKSFNGAITYESRIIDVSGAQPKGGYVGMAILNNGGFNGYTLFNNTDKDSTDGGSMILGTASGCSNAWVSNNLAKNTSPGTIGGIWGIQWPTTSVQNAFWPGGTLSTTNSAVSISGRVSVALGAMCSGLVGTDVDWIRVRKYSAVEPGAVLQPEKPNFPPTFTLWPTPSNILSGSSSTINAISTALVLNGSTDYASAPYNSALALGTTGTIEAWVLPNWSAGAISYNPTIIDLGSGSSIRYALEIDKNLNNVYLVNSTGIVATWAYTFTQGTWYHIAFVNTTATLGKIYVNGVAQANKTFSFTTSVSGVPLTIGANFVSAGNTNYFPGYIDEVQIWNTALAVGTIQANMFTNVAPGSAGLVAYYRFDEGSGTTANDFSSVANNATTSSNSLWTSTTAMGNSSTYTYAWTPSATLNTSTGTTVVATPSSTTTYTAVATNLNGKTYTTNTTITVHVVNANPGSPSSICVGGSASIGSTLVTGSTYSWTSSPSGFTSTSSSAVVNPTVTTTYTVTETNAGFSNSHSVTVTVNPLPTASISGGTSLCNGSTAPTMSVAVANTGGADWSLVYSDGTSQHTITGTGDETVTFPGSNSATTTYSLVSINETDGNGCSNTISGSATVTVNALPTPGVTSASILQGSSASIGSASNNTGDTYAWSPSGSLSSSSSSNPAATPTTTTTYTVTETNSNSCSASTTVMVTVTPLTVSVSGSPLTVCLGNTVNLSANAPAGVSYQWSNIAGPISGATSSTYGATTSGTYFVTVTNGNASATSLGAVVFINPLAGASVIANTAICSGQSINIGGNAVLLSSYSWTSSSTGNTVISTGPNPSVSPSATTTYTLIETNLLGCSGSNTVTITVNPLPAANAGSNTGILQGSSVSIGATAVGGSAYSWTPSTGLSSTTVSNPTATPSTTTTYTVTETNNNGCNASHTVTVSVTPLTISVSGNPTTFCAGGSGTLTANTNASNIQWYNGSGAITGATSSTYTATAAGTYYAIAGNGAASTTSSNIAVTVNPLPTATISGGTSVCNGSTAPVISVAVANTGGANWSLVYSDGTSMHTITGTGNSTATFTGSNSANTTYSLVSINETSGNGCSSNLSGSTSVTVNALPTANAGSDVSVAVGSSVQIGATSVSGSTYSWLPTTGLDNATSSSPNASPSSATTYTVTEKNANGCTSSNTVTVTVIYPAIDVQGNSNEISAASTSVSTTNATDFGTSYTGTSEETYTIFNNGGATLNISNVTIGGADASDFSITSSAASTVGTMSSTTFTVTFNASFAGTYHGTVTVSSNDPNTPSYTYAIQAAAAYPNIAVLGNGNNIAAGSTSVSTTNVTNFGTTTTGTSSETYTIKNTGGDTLNISSMNIGGTDASDFTITSSPSSQVYPGQSTTFTVSFNAASAGTYNGNVSIGSDDPNHPSYTYAIQATATYPAINVQGNNTDITAGSSSVSSTNATNFGTTTTGTSTETYTIQNKGGATLNITSISIDGTDASDFTVTSSPATSVSANGSTTFTVTFASVNPGTYNGAVTVNTNDPGTPAYTYAIQATAAFPNINVQGNSTDIAAGATTPSTSNATDYGTTATGSSSEVYTIQNTGTSALSISSVKIGGTDASHFNVTSSPALSVNANGSTSFTVTFSAAAAGTYNATVTVASNDPGTPAYTYAIQATAAYPAINVQGNNTNITAGSATASASNATDYGTVTSGSSIETYTIQNNGGANLNISSVSISGTNASNFSITSAAATSVTAGGSTSFNVTFTGTAAATYKATVTIKSNDPGTASYAYAIQATVTSANLPKVTPNGPTTFCKGGSVTLTVSGSTCGSTSKYQWYNGTTKITGATASSYKATTPGTYYVTVTTGSSSVTSLGTVVSYKAAPTEVASGAKTICSGTTATLSTTAVTGDSYTWWINSMPQEKMDWDKDDFGGYGATLNVSPSVTTNYILIASNGCTDTSNVTITVLASPSANAGSSKAICAGTSVQLGTSNNTTHSCGGTTTSTNTNFTYAWTSSPAGFTSTSGNPTVTPSATTTYHLTVSNGTCTASSSVTITVKASPTETAGSDQTICAGSSATLSTKSVSGDSYTWWINSMPKEKMDWDGDDYAGAGSSVTVKPSATTNYFLIATNGTCAETASVNVIVIPAPKATVTASGSLSFCSGGSVTLTVAAVTGAKYAWYNAVGPIMGATSTSYTATKAGTYYVIVTNSNGCSATSGNVTVTVKAAPNVSVCGDQNYNYGYDDHANISASCDQKGASFSWYDNDGKNCSNSQSWSCQPGKTSNYKCVASANGCTSQPETCKVNVRDCHDYDNNDRNRDSKCAICYYDKNKKQWYKTYVNKCDAYNDCKSGNYKFDDCGSGDNLDATASDEISIFPNPTTSTATIRLNFVQDGQVSIEVIDMQGRTVSNLYNGSVSAATPYNFTFDGSTLKSGIYMVRVIGGQAMQVRRIELLKN